MVVLSRDVAFGGPKGQEEKGGRGAIKRLDTELAAVKRVWLT